MKPVLLVHGYGGSHKMPWWSKIKNYLCENGCDHENIQCVNLGSIPATTIDSPSNYARHIREKAVDLHNKTGQNISIVAHSMGGINSRYFIEVLGGHKITDNLITLGTPHTGTDMAYLGYFSKGGRSLSRNSKIIDRINKNGLHENVNYTAIWGDKDFLVRPVKNAKLPENEMKKEDKNVKINQGHIRMILSETVYDKFLDDVLKCKI